MKNLTQLLLFLFVLATQAQDWTPLTSNQDLPGLERNPLKGIAANFGSDNGFPHSISSKNFSFGELYNDAGGFEFDAIENFIDEQAELGHFAMIQINVDDANLINPLDTFIENGEITYTGEVHDLPDFLSTVNRLYYQGRPAAGETQITDPNENVFPYDPADGGGNPSMVVDYNDTNLVDAIVALITELGNQYNGDKRLFIIHYGMYGIFGEWGLGAGQVYIDDLVDENGINLGLTAADWEMSAFNQGRMINAYQASFTNTNLVARVPDLPRPQDVGYSDGLYFGASLSDDPQFNYFFLPALESANADQNWKNYVIGGEMDPELQSKIWGALSPQGDFNYNVIGDSRFTQGQDIEQNVQDVFEQTHPTFVFQNYVMQQQFLGLEGGVHFTPDTPDPENFPYAGMNNQTFWDIAIKATKEMGYTFYVDQFHVSASNGFPAVEVNIQNTGIAPMYADWDIEFGYLDIQDPANPEDDTFVTLGTSSNWNLHKILPGDENERTFISSEMLDDGTYTFMIRIVNPLHSPVLLPDGTMKQYPNANPVRFANTTQDANLTGWLTLGEATIEDGTLGTFPVIASSIERDEPYQPVMNLDTQQVLKVIVAPANTDITWSSNKPQIVAVDQNGLARTFNTSGEAIITAFTNDGQEVEFPISVQSFWEIPSLIEAEDFSNYTLGAPSNPGARENLIGTGEDTGQIAIGFIGDNDVFEYSVNVKEDTDFVIDFRAVSFSGPGDSKMELSRENGEVIEEVTFGGQGVPNGTYGTFSSTPFSLAAGNHVLKFRVTRSNFDINWLRFKTCSESTTFTIAGGWDNGLPDGMKEAIIAENYDTATVGLGSFNACALIVSHGATLNISEGDFIQIENEITVNGSLIIEHTGSVVQVNDNTNVKNNGTVEVNLTTPELNARDFLIMGSPMTASVNTMFNAHQVLHHSTENFTPYIGVPPVLGVNFHDQESDDWSNFSGILSSGEGYLVRPSLTESGTHDYLYNEGTLTNGVITYDAFFGDDKEDSPNILSNPYPSAIDADALITLNPIIDELYFWEHNTTPGTDIPGPLSANFNMEDISTRNVLMGIAAATGGGEPSNIISTGQGFAIKANALGTVTFNNALRLAAGNSAIRNAENKDLIWIEIEEPTYGMGSTAGIGFTGNATAGFDAGYDTVKLGTVVSLYSHLEDERQQLSIQGRETFDSSMQISMGFSTLIEASGGIPYVISLSNVVGPTIEQATVYLIDTVTGVVTNLSTDRYEFLSDAGSFDNRFTLQFENEVLGIDDLTLESVTVYPNPVIDSIHIASPKTIVNSAAIYDLQGRLVQEVVFASEETNYKIDMGTFDTALYLVKIVTENGTITKRVLKK